MLKVQKFTFNPLAENTYVLYDALTKACAVVDPGCLGVDEQQILNHFIAAHNLQVIHLINTHCHIDHILGNAYVKRTYGVGLAIHPAEVHILALAPIYGRQYGINDYEPTTADVLLNPSQPIQIGNHSLQILYVPGHSPGHIALYSPAQQFCIGGDVLFKNAVGRTDLPGGDYATLLKSIREEFFSLQDRVVLYPGHGPRTTIGDEKRDNPFCKVEPV